MQVVLACNLNLLYVGFLYCILICLMQPVEMEDPYADEPPKCILCKHKIDLDYKVCVF